MEKIKIKFKQFLNLSNWRILQKGTPIENILGYNPLLITLNDKGEIIKSDCRFKNLYPKCSEDSLFYIFNKKVYFTHWGNLTFVEDSNYEYLSYPVYCFAFKTPPKEVYGTFKTSIILITIKIKSRIFKNKIKKWQKSS